MRVVGGSARGRHLRAPAGRHTRPTSDRVREAIFDILGSLGGVEDASVLDLFSGTGAMGIEAVSRGAASAVLVDSHPTALALMTDNISVLGPDADRIEVVRADAIAYVERAAFFQIVFADPPYAFTGWPRLFAALGGRAGLLVAEAAAAGEAFPFDPGPEWETVRVRRYGGTVVLVTRPGPGRS